MCTVSIRFEQAMGPMKPMHAVNNGPAHALSNESINNYEVWREAVSPLPPIRLYS